MASLPALALGKIEYRFFSYARCTRATDNKEYGANQYDHTRFDVFALFLARSGTSSVRTISLLCPPKISQSFLHIPF